jgi:NitT/TauT family transport system permease protein
MRMRNARLGNVLPPTVTALVFLAVWQIGVGFLNVPSYLIPTPWSVIVVLTQSLVSGFLWTDIWATVSAIIIGYAVGCTLAFLCAAAVSEFSLLERAFYPLIVAFQSVPKVALAPVIVVWFGFDLASKVVLICLICFFPCFVNTVVGLKSCPTDLIDLYRAFGARRAQIFWSIKVPSALTQIFAGLEISVVLALLGAVVAEFVSSRHGLGHVIQAASADFNVALMFASVVVLSIIGVLSTQLIGAIRHRVAFWEPGQSSARTSAP